MKDGTWLSNMGLEEAKTTIKRLLINLDDEKAAKYEAMRTEATFKDEFDHLVKFKNATL